GRDGPARQRYDASASTHLGIEVVRRPTGGRAVWHEHEVTYAVAAPLAAFGSLRGAYREIHRRLAAALRVLGAPATVAAGRAASLDGGPCLDRKSTRLNSSHGSISYAVFCLKKNKRPIEQ